MARRKDKPTARRAKGQGGYWQDKTGRHHYRITHNGQKFEVVDKDPERAKARFEDLKRSLKANIDVAGGRQSYRHFMTRYLETVVPNEVRKTSTASDYAKRAGLYILPTLGDFRLDALSTEIGQAWVNAMVEHGWSLNSIKQALSLAKRSLDRAVAEHLIPYNPFTAIKPPVPSERTRPQSTEADDEADDVQDGVGKVMRPEEREAFLEAIDKDDWLRPLYVLAFLGPRRGELLGFRWRDYDREKKLLRVRQQVVQIDGKVHITSPKTRKSRRSIPLTDWHIEMLDRHHVRWLDRKMQHHDTWQDEFDLIFCTRSGGPIEPSNLLRHYRRVLQRAGLGDIIQTDQGERFEAWFRFHDLRHTANQGMKDAGVDAKVRASILGHSGIKVTEEVYSHVSEEARREAIEQVSRRQK